jgi:quercetin dioxygenase-like cupin family protein
MPIPAGSRYVSASAASADHHAWSAEPWTRRFHLSLRGGAPYHPNAAGMAAVAVTESGGSLMMPAHQPGQDVFRSVRPEDIDWQPFPAFPPSARLAVVVGKPTAPGPYVIRVKVPSGVKLMPHRHPEDRVYTIISGVFYIGVGGQFDDGKLEAQPPGAVVVLPGGTPHFHWAKSGEYATQVTAIGPLGLEYLDPEDDPRNA